MVSVMATKTFKRTVEGQQRHVAYQRARNRARLRLAAQHRDEFKALIAEELAKELASAS